VIQNDDDNYILYIENYFTVKSKKQSKNKAEANSRNSGGRLNSTSAKQIVKEKGDKSVSYLGSKSDQIILDKTGRILNPAEIEEYGLWASKRVAYMLPLDYTLNK